MTISAFQVTLAWNTLFKDKKNSLLSPRTITSLVRAAHAQGNKCGLVYDRFGWEACGFRDDLTMAHLTLEHLIFCQPLKFFIHCGLAHAIFFLSALHFVPPPRAHRCIMMLNASGRTRLGPKSEFRHEGTANDPFPMRVPLKGSAGRSCTVLAPAFYDLVRISQNRVL